MTLQPPSNTTNNKFNNNKRFISDSFYPIYLIETIGKRKKFQINKNPPVARFTKCNPGEDRG
jgi:hypothetical protein